MVFPLMKEKFYRNYSNQTRFDSKDRFLNDCFDDCPKCRKQELIEVAKPEENLLIDFCLNCGYKKEKELEK